MNNIFYLILAGNNIIETNQNQIKIEKKTQKGVEKQEDISGISTNNRVGKSG
jgi:hypothetical protein